MRTNTWLMSAVLSLSLASKVNTCQSHCNVFFAMPLSVSSTASLHFSIFTNNQSCVQSVYNTSAHKTGLAQLPLLNGFARTPRDAWPENWALGKERPQVNAMSLEQLQEKDVLQDFVCCINLIGKASFFCDTALL